MAKKQTCKYKNPYLDSSAWIAWANGEVVDGVDRKAVVSDILKAAEDGKCQIHISAFTIAEVHKVRNQDPPKSDEEEEKILAFFEHSYVTPIDVERRVGEHANQLCRQYGLRPTDAVHLASALKAKCEVLLAWDRPLNGIKHPDIRIEEPDFAVGQMEIEDGEEEENDGDGDADDE